MTTPDNQILVALAPDDIVPANLFDLNGRTLVFTPDGQSGYSRSVLDLAWEEDLGGPVRDGEEIELNFQVEFSGREWESFFVSRRKQKYALARRSLRRLCFFGFEPFIHRLVALTSGIGCPSVSVGEVGYSFSDEILP